jgi:MtrB/PioB family decaheme-associated outer membrane protein
MRTRSLILTGALLLASAGLAQAQQFMPVTPFPDGPSLGQVNFGFRADSLSGDEARHNRFRDLRDGAYLDAFRFDKETDTWFFTASAANVGYRDQRYAGTFANIGRLEGSFSWDQIPLYISRDTRTLYTDQGNGVLAIDDSIQQRIQAGTLSIANAMPLAIGYDLKSRRDTAAFDLVYTVNRDIDLKFNLRNSNRTGSNLMSFGFGTSPGLNPMVEIAAPMDDRTTDVDGSVEFANARGLLSVGYNASWYDNAIPAVRFDNPLRATDISGGASVGQAAMWPTNTSAMINVNGSYALPARSRASAAVSVGRWSQDAELVPPTVNTALVAPPLERTTAETKANILSMVYQVNSRPTDSLWLNAKYRYYDYDNKSAHFEAMRLIGDWTLGTVVDETEPSSFKRKTLDLDASFAPLAFLAFGAGYTREDADRTWRIFENTAEDTFRLTVDSTGNQYVGLQLKYESSTREGSGFEAHLLEEVGEQPDTRHYDIANRDRYRVTALVTVTPVEQIGLNATLGTGKDDYKDSGFGLRDSKSNSWTAGFDYVPVDAVNFGLSYGFEKYTAYQYSRTASPLPSPQFNDPTRDWWTDQNDTVKTFTANLDLTKALPKTDIRFGYDLNDGKATYVYGLPANQTAFPTTPLAQLEPLKNRLTIGTFDVQYFLRPNVAVGVTYWYEDYQVDDFSQGPETINQLNLPSSIYSGYLMRDYTAHTGWLRLTYLW